MQTQTYNTLHNAIMEAGSKDRPLILAPDTKVSISEGSPDTRTESQMETYKTVSQDIRDQLNAKAEAVKIILTRIDNDIYSTVDACPNACKMWKEIERLKQGESINVQDLETNLYWEFGKFTSHDGESLDCQKPKRAKNAAYHREKILLCKKEEAGIQLNAEQADWRDDTDDAELEDQDLEAHYMYMAQLQEVYLDVVDSGPIFDDEPLQKVLNDDHYNVFTIESEHPEQSKFVHDT
nr:RNA-directed DNA polymerase, eukaryota [Tanacetum cinerariifolium]